MTCHGGLRAPRYATSVADIEQNPALFLCPDCGGILPGPLWRFSRHDSPAVRALTAEWYGPLSELERERI